MTTVAVHLWLIVFIIIKVLLYSINACSVNWKRRSVWSISMTYLVWIFYFKTLHQDSLDGQKSDHKWKSDLIIFGCWPYTLHRDNLLILAMIIRYQQFKHNNLKVKQFHFKLKPLTAPLFSFYPLDVIISNPTALFWSFIIWP